MADDDAFGVAGLGTGPVPCEPYVSEAFFDRERDAIFGRLWLNIARENEIPKPGDFIVRPIEARRASVLIVRGKDGVVRAFHNVCSHRQARVVWEARGSRKAFVCPYHAWTYALDGQLRGVPAEANFAGLNKADCGLTPIACESWNSFIFVNLDPAPATTLRDYIGDFADSVEGYPFEALDACGRVDMPVVNCNWKTLLDAFSEIYHTNVLHVRTLRQLHGGRANPMLDPLHFRAFGPHRSVSLPFNPDQSFGAVEMLSQQLAVNQGSTSGESREQATELLNHIPGLNPTKAPNWLLDINMIFPNTQWTIGLGTLAMHRFWPLDAHHTRYEAIYYFPRPTTPSERFAREMGFTFFVDAVSEDVRNAELSQEAMRSGAKKTIHLQSGEIAIRHHLNAVNHYVNGGAPHQPEARIREKIYA